MLDKQALETDCALRTGRVRLITKLRGFPPTSNYCDTNYT